MRASLPHSRDLNFKNVNRKPYWPTLSCLNRIGPFEVSLIARDISANSGEQRIRAAKLPAISIDLFTKRENFLSSSLSSKSGYSSAFANRPRLDLSPFSGKKWNDKCI